MNSSNLYLGDIRVMVDFYLDYGIVRLERVVIGGESAPASCFSEAQQREWIDVIRDEVADDERRAAQHLEDLREEARHSVEWCAA